MTIIPAGLSDSSGLGVLQFYSQGNTDSSASMIEGFRPDQKVEKREFIPLITWSELQGKIPDQQVAVVKIDVEGAELEVLESLKPCIQTYHPILLMEVLPSYSPENVLRVNRQDRIMDLLRGAEYLIYRVIKKKEKFIRLLQVDHFGIHGDLNLCEYVCVPLAKKETLKALEA